MQITNVQTGHRQDQFLRFGMYFHSISSLSHFTDIFDRQDKILSTSWPKYYFFGAHWLQPVGDDGTHWSVEFLEGNAYQFGGPTATSSGNLSSFLLSSQSINYTSKSSLTHTPRFLSKEANNTVKKERYAALAWGVLLGSA